MLFLLCMLQRTLSHMLPQDAGGKLIPSADLLAAGAKLEEGLYSTVKYNFNASVPAQKTGFINVLKTVSPMHAAVVYDGWLLLLLLSSTTSTPACLHRRPPSSTSSRRCVLLFARCCMIALLHDSARCGLYCVLCSMQCQKRCASKARGLHALSCL